MLDEPHPLSNFDLLLFGELTSLPRNVGRRVVHRGIFLQKKNAWKKLGLFLRTKKASKKTYCKKTKDWEQSPSIFPHLMIGLVLKLFNGVGIVAAFPEERYVVRGGRFQAVAHCVGDLTQEGRKTSKNEGRSLGKGCQDLFLMKTAARVRSNFDALHFREIF